MGGRGIVLLTIVISAGLHVGLATGLVAVAKNRDIRRRAISVAVQSEKKKEKPKPPPPPKPVVHAAPKPAAPPPAAAPVHSAPTHSAPVAMNLAMGNAAGGGGLDIGPGIGLHGRAEPAAAAAKVASSISEKRLQKVKDEAGGGGADAPCTEEPTKPEAVVKTELSYALHPQAQADGVEGKFKAVVNVDANGEVTDVEVVTSIEPAFDAALVAALKTWRFKPAMACGKPVAGVFRLGRTFELGD